MFIPNCRIDENYNEDFLNERDREFVRGMDYALEQVKNLFENNLDVYDEEMDYVPGPDEPCEEDEVYSTNEELYEIVSENGELIATIVDDWIEMERNELITGMIESMNDEEYKKLKDAAIERNNELPKDDPRRKEYCNSRKIYDIPKSKD